MSALLVLFGKKNYHSWFIEWNFRWEYYHPCCFTFPETKLRSLFWLLFVSSWNADYRSFQIWTWIYATYYFKKIAIIDILISIQCNHDYSLYSLILSIQGKGVMTTHWLLDHRSSTSGESSSSTVKRNITFAMWRDKWNWWCFTIIVVYVVLRVRYIRSTFSRRARKSF